MIYLFPFFVAPILFGLTWWVVIRLFTRDLNENSTVRSQQPGCNPFDFNDNIISLNKNLKQDLMLEIFNLTIVQVEIDKKIANGDNLISEQLRVQQELQDCVTRAKTMGYAEHKLSSPGTGRSYP